jgi:arylsulfatase A-like enzyme
MNVSAPRTPNFNALGVDHFDLLSTHPPLTDKLVAGVDALMQQRSGVLLSIDDLVAGLHNAVEDAGIMDNTYFFFSSDHGYHLGQACDRGFGADVSSVCYTTLDRPVIGVLVLTSPWTGL